MSSSKKALVAEEKMKTQRRSRAKTKDSGYDPPASAAPSASPQPRPKRRKSAAIAAAATAAERAQDRDGTQGAKPQQAKSSAGCTTSCKTLSPAQRLPGEMVHQVCAFLPLESVVAVGQVCGAWRAAVRDPACWRNSAVTYSFEEHGRFIRIMRAAPYLDNVTVDAQHQFEKTDVKQEIGTLTISSSRPLSSSPIALSTLNKPVRRLRLLNVSGFFTARAIDTKFPALKELTAHFSCPKPYIFKSKFIRESSLTTLRLRNPPAETLLSAVGAHWPTLQWLGCVLKGELARYRRPEAALPAGIADMNAALQMCLRLRTVEVSCCSLYGLKLPPSCSELVVALACNQCWWTLQPYLRCSLDMKQSQSCTGVRRLHLVSPRGNEGNYSSLATLRRHVDLLHTCLASFEEVSLRFYEPTPHESLMKTTADNLQRVEQLVMEHPNMRLVYLNKKNEMWFALF